MNKILVYDAEIFRNYASFVFIDFEDYLAVRKDMGDLNLPRDRNFPLAKDLHKFKDIPYIIFEISVVEGYEVNNLGGLMAYVSNDDYLTGFNNNGYDNLVLNFLLINSRKYRDIKKLLQKTYEFSKYLIETDKEILQKDESLRLIRNYHAGYKSIDVQKVSALDKVLKSLKQTAINLKWHNILEFNLPDVTAAEEELYEGWELGVIETWDRYIIKDFIKDLQNYNINDVLCTCELVWFLLEDIKLRFQIGIDYNINVLSASDSKIGDIFFKKYYTEATNIPVSYFSKGRTWRRTIALKDCVHESVSFRTMPFKKMLADIKNRTVESTTELDIKFEHEGVEYNIKSGGLHSVDYPAIFKSTTDVAIRDADVASYYPSLIINGKVKPKHLDDKFFDVYKVIVKERLEAKSSGDKIKAAVLKITANGVYGKFNFEYGPLLDRLCTLQVTITGQLQLLMLVERLTNVGFKVISANTDGIVTEVPIERDKKYYDICDEWQRDTKLSLEYTDYPIYIRRDVNNYFTVKNMNDPYNSIKAKGQLDEFLRIAYPKLQKGFNMPVVAHAVQRFFIENKPVMETLKEHKDIYDFCRTTNIGSQFKLQLFSSDKGIIIKEDIQRSTRYYVSTNGGMLYKVKKFGNQKFHLNKDGKVTIFNQYFHNENFANYHIDYGYYHRAAMKIINHIKTGVRPGAGSAKKIKQRLDQGTLF